MAQAATSKDYSHHSALRACEVGDAARHDSSIGRSVLGVDELSAATERLDCKPSASWCGKTVVCSVFTVKSFETCIICSWSTNTGKK